MSWSSRPFIRTLNHKRETPGDFGSNHETDGRGVLRLHVFTLFIESHFLFLLTTICIFKCAILRCIESTLSKHKLYNEIWLFYEVFDPIVSCLLARSWPWSWSKECGWNDFLYTPHFDEFFVHCAAVLPACAYVLQQHSNEKWWIESQLCQGVLDW